MGRCGRFWENPHSEQAISLAGTRFKGRRNSPNEFKQFIGKGMKMSRVEHASKTDAADILTFYMGKHTPERKDCIMGSLVVLVAA